MIRRFANPLKSNSFFLFGARGTGKSTLLKSLFKNEKAFWVDLLIPEQEDLYSRRPQELLERLEELQDVRWVIIDEIQKIPRLLDVVHSLIEGRGLKFAMTGSSARKLKRGSANLLAGRAFVNNLFPFCHFELGEQFDLGEALSHGTLPGLLRLKTAEEKRAFLHAYALVYLKEEIWAEHVIRKMEPFRNFLEVAAQGNGEPVNHAKIARDVSTNDNNVRGYYQILEDTLLGFLLEPYHASIRKRQTRAPKFYFFDLGVKRALDRTLHVPMLPGTYEYGKAFEHFIILELLRWSHYRQNDFRFSYLRTRDDLEIDLVIERPGRPVALVEIKSTDRVGDDDVKVLARLSGGFKESESFCLSRDPHPKRIQGVRALPWKAGIASVLG